MVRIASTSKVRHDGPSGDPGAWIRPGSSPADRAFRLVDPHFFQDPGSDRCRDFLRMVFRIEEVRSVEIDHVGGAALIRYVSEALGAEEMQIRLAEVLSGRHGRIEDHRLGPISTPGEGRSPVKVSRYGLFLSTWEVVHQLPGRLRLRHEAIASDGPLAHRVARELAAVHGVASCRVGSLTSSLLVHHDPAGITPPQIIHVLDHLIGGSGLSMAHDGDAPAVHFGLANASVGLAVLGEFAVPALLPASAVLLVASNVRTIRAAWEEARRRQVGLPMLSATIITATLASGQFVAASLMGWMIKFWRHRHREQHHSTRLRLLPGMAQHRRFARLVVGDSEVDVALERLRPGDRVSVSAGEFLPADGRATRGSALVDERAIRGGTGLIPKRAGDPVFAGSRAVAGEIQFQVEAVGPSTKAAILASAVLSAATSPHSPHAVTAHGEAFARRAVVPTLATAGLALLAGDLTTAAAVLRPDYSTGPGLGVSLEVLRDASACAGEGVVIRDAAAFGRLAGCDAIFFDDHPGLTRTALVVDAIRAVGDDDILLLAAEALRDLGDERAQALRSACEARGLAPLDVAPDHGPTGMSFRHGASLITVGDEAGGERATQGPSTRGTSFADLAMADRPPLVLSADGRAIGRITFRRGDRSLAASAIRNLRTSPHLAVGLLSGRGESEANTLAASLGIDHVGWDLSPAARAELLRSLRDRGVKVAYVGDCRVDDLAAREAHVAISLVDEFDPKLDPAPIVMLPGDLSRVAWLHALARSHVSRSRTVHGAALIPNIVCVAGAFFFGFTSLSSVIITNLGTLGIYSGLPHRARSRRPSLVRPGEIAMDRRPPESAGTFPAESRV